jgi:hypothetical protein
LAEQRIDLAQRSAKPEEAIAEAGKPKVDFNLIRRCPNVADDAREVRLERNGSSPYRVLILIHVNAKRRLTVQRVWLGGASKF